VGDRKIKTKNKNSQGLKKELSKIGYSEKAIQEIGKWITLE